MARKKALTLLLSDEDMALLRSLAEAKDLPKSGVIKQAIRFYAAITNRIQAGEEILVRKKSEEGKERLESMYLT